MGGCKGTSESTSRSTTKRIGGEHLQIELASPLRGAIWRFAGRFPGRFFGQFVCKFESLCLCSCVSVLRASRLWSFALVPLADERPLLLPDEPRAFSQAEQIPKRRTSNQTHENAQVHGELARAENGDKWICCGVACVRKVHPRSRATIPRSHQSDTSERRLSIQCNEQSRLLMRRET